MNRHLLLVSNSTQHGQGYLTHCAAAVQELFDGCDDLVFVPYALHDWDAYAASAVQRFADLGFRMSSVHQADDPVDAVAQAGGIFVGGGNTFRLTRQVHELGLVPAIRTGVAAGMPYLGTSAGSNLACATICTTNDMPIVYPPTFAGLQLVPFQINPHFIDSDSRSTHMGETREKRIQEFHEENPQPVIGLREGAWLWVNDNQQVLAGTTGAKLFRRGQPPRECRTGEDLSEELLNFERD